MTSKYTWSVETSVKKKSQGSFQLSKTINYHFDLPQSTALSFNRKISFLLVFSDFKNIISKNVLHFLYVSIPVWRGLYFISIYNCNTKFFYTPFLDRILMCSVIFSSKKRGIFSYNFVEGTSLQYISNLCIHTLGTTFSWLCIFSLENNFSSISFLGIVILSILMGF